MKSLLSATAVFVIAVLTSLPASASDRGLLNLLDSYMEPAEQKETEREESVLEGLGENFEGSLRLRFVRYPEFPTMFVIDPRKKRHEAEALLRWSTWTGKGPYSFHISGWFEGGTQKDTYRGISPVFKDDSRKRRYAELSELYVVRSGNDWDLTLGKKAFTNRIAAIFSPGDRYSSFDLTDPMDRKIFGSWMLTYDHYIRDTSFSFSVLPVFQPKKLPGLWSRWVDTGLTGDIPDLSKYSKEDIETGNVLIDDTPFQFTLPPGAQDEMLSIMYYFWGLFFADRAASGELRRQSERLLGAIRNTDLYPVERLPRSGLRDAGWFARVKHSMDRWDFFLSAYYGPGLYPVLKLERSDPFVVLVKENPDVFNLAGGLSTTWRSLALYGEILYNRSIKRRDESYINGVIGVRFSDQDLAQALHLHRIDLCVEYSREYVTTKQSAPWYIATSRFMRIGREDIFALIRVGLTEDLALYAGLNETLWNDSRFYRFGGQYRIRPGLTVDVAAEKFKGPFYTYYGRWDKNDRYLAMMTWSF